jgi:peptide/nickel transport system substrate-binding protein
VQYRRWLCLLSLVSLIYVLPALAQDRRETLLVVTEVGPNSMDIHGVGANRPSYGLSWHVYDRLLTYGKKTLPDGTVTYDYSGLEPELATSWQVAPDGMSVTFTLRPEAKFHDGTSVTAHDVKWSFDRAISIGGFPTFQMKAGSLLPMNRPRASMSSHRQLSWS